MRALVIVEPGVIGPPPEAMTALLGAFSQWRAKWRPKMETFEFFAGRPGGWTAVNCADETELSQMMMEFPFGPFSVVSVHPTVNGDDALARLTATVQQQMAAMGMPPK